LRGRNHGRSETGGTAWIRAGHMATKSIINIKYIF
jgi:hypothetical protein